jgi:hypothetical protein
MLDGYYLETRYRDFTLVDDGPAHSFSGSGEPVQHVGSLEDVALLFGRKPGG